MGSRWVTDTPFGAACLPRRWGRLATSGHEPVQWRQGGCLCAAARNGWISLLTLREVEHHDVVVAGAQIDRLQ